MLDIYEKKIIKKEDLFSKISSLDIFRSYCPNFEIGNRIQSPFRKDKDPSFGFFKGKRDEIMFKDFATEDKGDCVDFVQKMFSMSYFEALSKIATDFNFGECSFFYKDMSDIKHNVTVLNEDERNSLMEGFTKPLVSIKMRDWLKVDADYWATRGVNYKTLQYYRVVPITHIFINDKIIVADKLAYAFIETKDGEETYKIYQPLNKEGLKWFSSHDSSVWQGWTQLPERAPELIITKSLKDVMAIGNILRIPAIAMQSENVLPKDHVVHQLRKRFEEIYILYDNDFDKEVNTGREMGKRIANSIEGSMQIELPDEWRSKDFSDFTHKNVTEVGSIKEGYEKTNNLFRTLLIPF